MESSCQHDDVFPDLYLFTNVTINNNRDSKNVDFRTICVYVISYRYSFVVDHILNDTANS